MSVKMFFPENKYVNDFCYEGGKVHTIEETPGTVDRWLRRGCTIVEEKVIEEKKEELVEKIVEKIEEKIETKEEKKPKKKILKKKTKVKK